jgi:hypothetical protein
MAHLHARGDEKGLCVRMLNETGGSPPGAERRRVDGVVQVVARFTSAHGDGVRESQEEEESGES